MLRFVIKQVIRGFRRNVFYFSSTIVGFGSALLLCILVTSLLLREYSTDGFHGNAIFRISMVSPVGEEREIVTYHELAAQIKDVLPEVGQVTHTYYPGFIPISVKSNVGKLVYREKTALFADSEFLQIFKFSLIKGDRKTCLSNVDGVVMTSEKAISYFGSTDIIGETLEALGRIFTVTGILDNSLENSHLKVDMLFSYSSLAPPSQPLQYPGFTYFTLNGRNLDHKSLEKKLNFYRSKLLSFKPDRWPRDPFLVEPIEEVYYNTHYPEYLSNIVKSRDKRSLSLFAIMACSILVVATINFLVCYFTKTLFDSKEIRLKKIFGVEKGWLFAQFSFEAFLILFLSLVFSLVAAALLLPRFYAWAGATVSPNIIFSPYTVPTIFVSIILLSLLLGLATFSGISMYDGGTALNTGTNPHAKLKMLNIVFVVQLMFSSTLLISNSIIQNQIKFIYDEPIGYAKEELIEIDLSSLPDDFNPRMLKNEIQALAHVKSASVCVGGPMTGRWERDVTHNGAVANLGWYQVDEDFITTLGMDIIYGTNFDKNLGSDSSYLLINETASKFFEIGYNIDSIRSDLPIGGKIVGIVKDFHYSSFKRKVGPVFITRTPFHALGPLKGKLVVRASSLNEATIAPIKGVWDRITNNAFFDYSFLSSDYLAQYAKDKNESKLLELTSIIILVISCFGVIGISYFFSYKSVREIAIKKLLGASDFALISGWLLKVIFGIIISFIIACPISMFLTEHWMENYVYKKEFSAGPVLLSFVIVALSLGFSASYNLNKAIRRKPVDVLKYQ